MKQFSIQSLARTIAAEPTERLDGLITAVSVDSRTIKPGDCFFAIAGENFDGHDYVPDAFEKGAACAVVSRDSSADKRCGKIVLKVDDTTKALGHFAAWYRRQAAFKVVAITGSVGKTTTRQIIYHALSSRFRCHQAPKNFNNQIGLPLTLLGAESDCEIVIAELASSFPGEIAYLAKITRPDIAVITNVYPVHLEGLGDIETIIREKTSIAQGLQAGGTLLINGDFPRLLEACRSRSLRFTTFGKSGNNRFGATNITCNAEGSRFTIDGTRLELPLAGAGNVDNALAAWAVCSRLGISYDNFAEALKTLPTIPMRTEILSISSLTVLNDCYNANPASMKNALEILANLGRGKKRRLVFVCGDMAELGRQRRLLHKELGRQTAQTGVQMLITVGRLAGIAANAAKGQADYDLQTVSFDDTLSACNNLEKFIKNTDIVLVKGSRTVGLEMIVEKLKQLFS